MKRFLLPIAVALVVSLAACAGTHHDLHCDLVNGQLLCSGDVGGPVAL